MKKTFGILVAAVLLASWVSLALAQDQEYALKDYMPQAIGAKWIMKTTNRQGETTITVEVEKPKEGQPGLAFMTKAADGSVQRGSLESVYDANYTVFGQIRMPRGQQGGEPTVSLFDPPLAFPAKLAVGKPVEVKTKTTFGQQAMDVTIRLELAAVESVTVPKGKFDDCLKLVTTRVTQRGEMKSTTWYAKGIGAIKTEQPAMGQNQQNQAPRVAEMIEYVPGQ